MKAGPGIYTLEDLQARCYITETQCWHWRLSYESKTPRASDGRTGRRVSARLLAVQLSGKKIRANQVVYPRLGCSHECVNPAHAILDTYRAKCLHYAKQPAFRNPQRLAPLLAAAKSRRKVDDAGRLEIRLSTKPLKVLAEEWGIAEATVKAIRSKKSKLPANSVFNLAATMGVA
jgi:hypothetical protein